MQGPNRRPATAVARRGVEMLGRRDFLRRYGLGGLGALVGVGAVVSGAGAAYTAAYRGAIFGGVRVAGIALGGLDRGAAIGRLDAAFADYAERPIPVGAAGAASRWRATPAALGATVDSGAAAEAALAIGRSGDPLRRLGDPLRRLGDRLDALLGGVDLPLPVVVLDDGHFDALLRAWAPEVTALPTDAAFADDNGALALVPDRDGRGIEPAASTARFRERLARLSSAPVELALVPIVADITAADLEGIRPEASALVGTPVTLRSGSRQWPVGPDLLRAALVYGRAADGQLEPGLRAGPLRPFLDWLAGEIATPAADARIAPDGNGQYRITPEVAGAFLDADCTLAALTAALRADRREADLALSPQPARTTAADLAPVFKRLDGILNTPLVATFQEFSRTYGRAEIAPLIAVTPRPETPERVAITVDDAKLGALVADLARTLNRDPRDAEYRWRGGVVQDVAGGQDGRAVQADASAAAIRAAILGATGKATLAVTLTKPNLPTVDKATIVIRDRLGQGKTPYAGSIPNRKHNVELAVSRLDGATIAPNGIFSFNTATGAQTIDNGYLQGFGIALVGGNDDGSGKYKAVPSVGGGICQVSTTIFQAVYQAGLPLEERNWHAVWLPNYGPPNSPTGMKGLDATVDDQAGLDFKFRNTTGGWIAVEAAADGSWVTVTLRGIDPGWTVKNDEPIISDPKPADQTVATEKTHDLPPGQRVLIEAREDGFSATQHTVVTDRTGKVLRDKIFQSKYAPAQELWQVGVPANEPLN